MDGYATSARIERASTRVRLRGAAAVGTSDAEPSPIEEMPVEALPSVGEVSGRPFAADLIELLADIRDVCRQGREVLADPQGWRVGF